MRCRLALRLLLGVLLSAAVPAVWSHAASMERGVAITDPDVLRALDDAKLSLARLLGADAGASSATLFALPSMASVQAATDRDFNAYVIAQKNTLERLHLFDRDALNAPGTRFELAGVVNRMDRAYVTPDECGEIRLIYRPVTNSDVTGKDAAPSRLPMTLSLIVKAKPAAAMGLTCGELAGRWLALIDPRPADKAAALAASGGALEWITREAIDRIEINIQVARASLDAANIEGRADYLMKVFHLDPQRNLFAESPMENQIDVERIWADPILAADFKQWLLDPARMVDLDRGTIVLPDRFLAMSAISVTPSSLDGDSAARDLFTDDDIVTALAKAATAAPLENILSPSGFARRLDDMTCAGCHRTRAVGGFHVTGKERLGRASSSAIVAAASPHFVGDQQRRRDVLMAFRDNRAPDFSRGFSARPQPRRAGELAGTTYVNGWGALCHAPGSSAPDASFASWTCADGLACQPPVGVKDARTGFCFPKN